MYALKRFNDVSERVSTGRLHVDGLQILTEASELSRTSSLQVLSCSMLRYIGYTSVTCSMLM